MAIVDRPAGLAEPAADDVLLGQAREALERGREALIASQDAAGWWCGELEANVAIQAEYLLLLHFLGLRDDDRWADVVRYIDSRQQADGGWPIYYGGPSDLSVTVEAYAALKLAGRPASDVRLAAARAFILAAGSLPRTRVFTKIWLALFGLYPWSGVPIMPPELLLLPDNAPLSIYQFSSWARGTIVPLSIVLSRRPRRPFPPGVDLDELTAGLPPAAFALPRPPSFGSWRGAFWLADRLLRRVPPLPWLRAHTLRLAERWVLDHQERDGSWGGIQPPWVYSILALTVCGYAVDHPVIAKALAGMEAFGVQDGQGWRVQPCVSAVWDTALGLIGLLDSGLTAAALPVSRAIDWLLGQQIRAPGDWQVKAAPGTPSGGWAFEFHNEGYPDTDDTAMVVTALLKALPGVADPRRARAITQAVALATQWLEGMRSSNGAWGSFDVDNDADIVTKIPFADFGETLDPPTEDVTAHVVEAFGASGRRDGAGIAYLARTQQLDGSWWGRWGVNYIYGTAAALPALRAAGLDAADPRVVSAAAWLRRCQQADGGWGESPGSYDDSARGSGPPTASQTAWALIGLLAADEHDGDAVRRGITWLVQHQHKDGRWDEPEFTGTGFPGAFMINYHLYRQYFPVIALGRFVHGLQR